MSAPASWAIRGTTRDVTSWRTATFLLNFHALRPDPCASIGSHFVRELGREVGETRLLGRVLRFALEDVRMLETGVPLGDGDEAVGAAARRFLRAIRQVGSPSEHGGAPTFNAAPHLPPRQLRDSEHKFVRHFERASADRETLVALVYGRAKLSDFVHDVCLERVRRLVRVPASTWQACAELARDRSLLAREPRLPSAGTSLVCQLARAIPLADVPKVGAALGSWLPHATLRAALRTCRAWHLLCMHAPADAQATVRIGAGALFARDLLPESAGGRTAGPLVCPFHDARRFLVDGGRRDCRRGAVSTLGCAVLRNLPSSTHSLRLRGWVGAQALGALHTMGVVFTRLRVFAAPAILAHPSDAVVRDVVPHLGLVRTLTIPHLEFHRRALEWLLTGKTTLRSLTVSTGCSCGPGKCVLGDDLGFPKLRRLQLPAASLTNELVPVWNRMSAFKCTLHVTGHPDAATHRRALVVRSLHLAQPPLRGASMWGRVTHVLHTLTVRLPPACAVVPTLRALRARWNTALNVTLHVDVDVHFASARATDVSGAKWPAATKGRWPTVTFALEQPPPHRSWVASPLGEVVCALVRSDVTRDVGVQWPLPWHPTDVDWRPHTSALSHAAWALGGEPALHVAGRWLEGDRTLRVRADVPRPAC